MTKIIFSANGHINVLSTHRNTLEFTKDKELTRNGDCIVAVDADFDIERLKPLLTAKKIKCIISIGKLKDEFTFNPNPYFSDNHEVVIRRTDFSSPRTFGIHCNKASIDLNRELIEKLKDPKAKLTIEFLALG